jgi:seryl-tRNA(Sec) selenium transferase
MKVGREQIFGLVAAIQDYLLEPSYQVGDAEVNECKKVLDQGDMLRSETRFYSPLNVTNLHIPAPKHLSADQFYNLLASGTPRIILGQEMSDKGFLTLNPMALQKGEGSLIGRRINEIAKEG